MVSAHASHTDKLNLTETQSIHPNEQRITQNSHWHVLSHTMHMNNKISGEHFNTRMNKTAHCHWLRWLQRDCVTMTHAASPKHFFSMYKKWVYQAGRSFCATKYFQKNLEEVWGWAGAVQEQRKKEEKVQLYHTILLTTTAGRTKGRKQGEEDRRPLVETHRHCYLKCVKFSCKCLWLSHKWFKFSEKV